MLINEESKFANIEFVRIKSPSRWPSLGWIGNKCCLNVLGSKGNYLKTPSTGSTRGSQASYLSLYDLAAKEKPTVEFI